MVHDCDVVLGFCAYCARRRVFTPSLHFREDSKKAICGFERLQSLFPSNFSSSNLSTVFSRLSTSNMSSR